MLSKIIPPHYTCVLPLPSPTYLPSFRPSFIHSTFLFLRLRRCTYTTYLSGFGIRFSSIGNGDLVIWWMDGWVLQHMEWTGLNWNGVYIYIGWDYGARSFFIQGGNYRRAILKVVLYEHRRDRNSSRHGWLFIHPHTRKGNFFTVGVQMCVPDGEIPPRSIRFEKVFFQCMYVEGRAVSQSIELLLYCTCGKDSDSDSDIWLF